LGEPLGEAGKASPRMLLNLRRSFLFFASFLCRTSLRPLGRAGPFPLFISPVRPAKAVPQGSFFLPLRYRRYPLWSLTFRFFFTIKPSSPLYLYLSNCSLRKQVIPACRPSSYTPTPLPLSFTFSLASRCSLPWASAPVPDYLITLFGPDSPSVDLIRPPVPTLRNVRPFVSSEASPIWDLSHYDCSLPLDLSFLISFFSPSSPGTLVFRVSLCCAFPHIFVIRPSSVSLSRKQRRTLLSW